jgi:hypothetical protein
MANELLERSQALDEFASGMPAKILHRTSRRLVSMANELLECSQALLASGPRAAGL